MKFCLFHLMPYAPLDLDFDKKYPTRPGWRCRTAITIPSRAIILYNRYLDELELGDQLGFDVLCVNEHHQTAYGLMPMPGVIAGALSRRTKRARIAVLGRALPLLNNPLSVAEEYAMLDNITGGRLIAGFVRGIGVEYHSTGANPGEVARALPRGARPDPAGLDPDRAVRLRGQALPVPLREPVAAAVSAAASADLDSVAGLDRDDRVGLASGPQIHLSADVQPGGAGQALPRANTRKQREQLRLRGVARQARLGAADLCRRDTDESARREAKPHIEAMYNKFLRMPFEYLLPPGYTSVASMKKLRAGEGVLHLGRAARLRRIHPPRHVHLRQPGDGARRRSSITRRTSASTFWWR